MAEKVAIIIPLKNEQQGLESLLTSLLQQSYRADEIIAVDTGSEDNTLPILESYTMRFDIIRTISAPYALPGKARNEGIKATNAEIIVHIDGGCYVESDWLASMVLPIIENRADYVTGAVFPLPTIVKWCGRRHDLSALIMASSGGLNTRRSRTEMAGGANVAYRRVIWEQVGGQPEWLRRGEDFLFVKKLAGTHIRHHFNAESPFYWQPGPSLFNAMRRQWLYIITDLRMGYNVRRYIRIFFRTGMCVVLLGASAVYPGVLFILIPAVLAYWMRDVTKIFGKYYAYASYTAMLPVYMALPALCVLSLVWIFLKHISACIGVILRMRSNEYTSKRDTYLTSFPVSQTTETW